MEVDPFVVLKGSEPNEARQHNEVTKVYEMTMLRVMGLFVFFLLFLFAPVRPPVCLVFLPRSTTNELQRVSCNRLEMPKAVQYI